MLKGNQEELFSEESFLQAEEVLPSLKRNGDKLLPIIARQVRKHHGRQVRKNSHNPFVITPRTMFIGITHLEMLNSYIWATRGAITEDTLTNPDRDHFVFVESRVGTNKGTGIGYESEFLPFKRGYRALEKIVDASARSAFRTSVESYHDFHAQADLEERVRFPNLIPVDGEEPYLERVRVKRLPLAFLRKLAKKCSSILSEGGNDGRVRILPHDEVRRYVNSEGTVIRDTFFGYHVKFEVKTFDEKNRPIKVFQHYYLTENWQIRWWEDKILNFVKRMAKEIDLRKKECPILPDGLYPTLYTANGMASELHETVVHTMASDYVLQGTSPWGIANFGKQVANRYITVVSDPAMTESWGGLKWGSMKYDYEGMRAMKRALIEDGRIVGYLADRNGAYHLSKMTGAVICPGDSRWVILNNNTAFQPQPRISNLDISWKGPRKAKSKRQLTERFLQYLRKHNLTGLYIADEGGYGAASSTDDGQMESMPNFPYIVTPEGKFIPTKFIQTRNYASMFMKNIMVMGEPRRYCPHRCDDDGATVRAGIMCGPGIVKNVYVTRVEPEKMRNL